MRILSEKDDSGGDIGSDVLPGVHFKGNVEAQLCDVAIGRHNIYAASQESLPDTIADEVDSSTAWNLVAQS